MKTLSELVKSIKRRARYGDISNISDQITADIISYINTARFDIWRRYPWWWAIEEYNLNVISGQSDYTLDSGVGDILGISAPNEYGGNLSRLDLKTYIRYYKGSISDSTSVSYYVVLGRDSATKAIKIRLIATPSTNATIQVYAKKKIDRYSVSDINTNTEIELFPEEVVDLIEEGALAPVYEAKGEKELALAKINYFKNELERMIKEIKSVSDSPERDYPSDYILFHRNRGSGTQVT